MWGVIVLIPDHCLSIYFYIKVNNKKIINVRPNPIQLSGQTPDLRWFANS